MYGKLFTSLYQGTLRGCSDEILVFTNLIAHADAHGHVDKHYRAIAEETGIDVDRVKAALANLEAPDPESRSPEEEGRRIVPIDEHRAWGWRIVNYPKYRSIRNEDDRREQNRLAQQRWRDKQKQADVSTVSQDKPLSAQAEAEAEAEADTEEEKQKKKQQLPKKASPKTDEEWLTSLQNSEVYSHLNVRHEFGKAGVWCETNGRQCTRRFFVNWLNKARPMESSIKANGTSNGNAYDPRKDIMSPHYEMPPTRTSFRDACDYYFKCEDFEHSRTEYERMRGNWLKTSWATGYEKEVDEYERSSVFRERFGEKGSVTTGTRDANGRGVSRRKESDPVPVS